MHRLCALAAVSEETVGKLDPFIAAHRQVRKGGQLFGIGVPFRDVFSVRNGSFKTSLVTAEGREQVIGFHIPGDLFGLDGIGMGVHQSMATALENSEVCVFPYERVARATVQGSELGNSLNRLMSQALVKEQGVLLMLRTMRSQQRVAAFLLDLLERHSHASGKPLSKAVMSMTRSEIGSLLGLTQETVSRVLATFAKAGMIRIRSKVVEVRDFAYLREIATSKDVGSSSISTGTY